MTLVVGSGRLAVDMTETRLQRLEWLVKHRAGGNQRELARMANMKHPSHLATIISRLRENPNARIEDDTLVAIANAAGVHAAWLSRGELPRDRSEALVERSSRYASLEDVLKTFPARWSLPAVGAARSTQLDADSDPGEAWWVEQLDRFEQALKLAAMALPPKTPAGNPLADLDAPPVRDARKKKR